MSHRECTIIADNGGGLTLQVSNGAEYIYQHTYNLPRQCAEDIKQLLSGADPATWDGNEIDDGLLIPTDEEIRNGGYRVLSTDDLFRTTSSESWNNVRELRRALNAMKKG